MNDWRDEYRLNALLLEFKTRVASARRMVATISMETAGISVSYGKDSTVLLDIVAKRYGIKPHAFHITNPASLPGYENVLSWYQNNAILSVLPAPPLVSYISEIKILGLPHERTDKEQTNFVKEHKKTLGTEWAKNNGIKNLFLGMRADESSRRRFLSRAPRFTARGIIHVCPLYNWTAKDIWTYIVIENLPYHPMYDCETHGFKRETIRNSGFLTTDSLKGCKNNSYIAWLATHYPQQYAILQREFPKIARWK